MTATLISFPLVLESVMGKNSLPRDTGARMTPRLPQFTFPRLPQVQIYRLTLKGMDEHTKIRPSKQHLILEENEKAEGEENSHRKTHQKNRSADTEKYKKEQKGT